MLLKVNSALLHTSDFPTGWPGIVGCGVVGFLSCKVTLILLSRDGCVELGTCPTIHSQATTSIRHNINNTVRGLVGSTLAQLPLSSGLTKGAIELWAT
ncbi:hypothetical protein Pmani_027460 [Petrolisthes manimaculis]|uniref:Uncharacterized protein n=1 Tax=Petrolisthes manimaculis TaxID=1843537 RepID=A0AAE1TVQ9_9EUCA|nr:hypothetical protein Pmani_027460 [Petrolisthes manimaculis]